MNRESIENTLSRFSSLLLAISIALIVGGAGLMFYFGYVVYILLSSPEQSHFMTYLLQQLPAPAEPFYTLSGSSDGKSIEINIPTPVLLYGRYILAFMIWSVVGGIVVQLMSAGLSIFKVLTQVTKTKNLNQKELNDADTRNSHNSR